MVTIRAVFVLSLLLFAPVAMVRGEETAPLSVDYVLGMLESGMEQDEIVYRIIEKNLTFRLTAEDVDRLRAAGASDTLIRVVTRDGAALTELDDWSRPRRLESPEPAPGGSDEAEVEESAEDPYEEGDGGYGGAVYIYGGYPYFSFGWYPYYGYPYYSAHYYSHYYSPYYYGYGSRHGHSYYGHGHHGRTHRNHLRGSSGRHQDGHTARPHRSHSGGRHGLRGGGGHSRGRHVSAPSGSRHRGRSMSRGSGGHRGRSMSRGGGGHHRGHSGSASRGSGSRGRGGRGRSR